MCVKSPHYSEFSIAIIVYFVCVLQALKMSRDVIILVPSLLLLCCSAYGYKLEDGGKIWALLVAGSSGYDNYRHQV